MSAAVDERENGSMGYSRAERCARCGLGGLTWLVDTGRSRRYFHPLCSLAHFSVSLRTPAAAVADRNPEQ